MVKMYTDPRVYHVCGLRDIHTEIDPFDPTWLGQFQIDPGSL